MWTASGTRNFLLLGPGPYVRARPRPYLTHRLAPQSPRRLRWQGKSDGHGREPRVKASESFSTMYRLCLGSRARSVEADRQQENSRERQPPNTPASTLYGLRVPAGWRDFFFHAEYTVKCIAYSCDIYEYDTYSCIRRIYVDHNRWICGSV